MTNENQYVPFGPDWEKEMMHFKKERLISLLRSSLMETRIKQASPMDAFELLFLSHGEFSDKTFGKDRGPLGPINHLKKEVEELASAPEDKEEYADCLLLLIDAFRRSGSGDVRDFIHSAFVKLDINRQREWGEPDENGVVEHIK